MRQPEYENLYQIYLGLRADIAKRTERPELPFGLTELDSRTHGLRRGRITVIAARPSEGKTSLGLQIGWNLACSEGKTVCYVSLEDDRKQLVERVLCNAQRIENTQLIRGLWSEDTDRKAKAMEAAFKKIKFLVVDGFGYNWQEFQTLIEKTQPKPDVIFLDYINMIELNKGMNKRDTIGEFIRASKAWALKENIAIVILAQINRAGAEDKRPKLHHLKDCGTLEEVADVCLLNYYPIRYGEKDRNGEPYGPEYLEIEIAKIKNYGRPGIVPVKFLGRYYRFEDWQEIELKQPEREAYHERAYR